MPVPTNTRHDQVMNTPSLMTTPARSSYLRNTSNASYSPTVTSGGGPQKLNVVTRVAIEGKAKRGQDGASIRMFLKVSWKIHDVFFSFNLALAGTDLSSIGFRDTWFHHPAFSRSVSRGSQSCTI